jgi:hypothetical protein
MEHRKEAFASRGFLDLLADVAHHDVRGVLNNTSARFSHSFIWLGVGR